MTSGALAPAIVAALYSDSTGLRSRPILERLLRAAAPGDLAVALHTSPDDGDARLVAMARELGLRLWWGLPYDGVARALRQSGGAVARALAATWARHVHQIAPDVEVVCLDGEALWRADAAADVATLGALALDVIEATRVGCPNARVSWTSFDHPLWHRLPWGAILGPGGVDMHAPQIYAAPEQGVADLAAARRRFEAQDEQWRVLADRHPAIRRELLTGCAGWTPYVQAHHVALAGTVELMDRADTARVWAIPSRCDDAGVIAVESLLRMRRAVGRSRGTVRRYQAMRGLVPDGICGPRTLALLDAEARG